MPPKLREKYLHKLVGDKDFFPKLVHKGAEDGNTSDPFLKGGRDSEVGFLWSF